jgi:hypothetical protein
MPAAFSSLVISLATTAAVHFGDVSEPGTGEKGRPNLEGAAQMIEILGILEEKTRGNLSPDESRLLEEVLFELRIRFVRAQRDEKRIVEP